MTKAAEERLKELLRRVVGPAEVDGRFVAWTERYLRSTCEADHVQHRVQTTSTMAELLGTLLNTAHDMLQELAHLRAPHKAGTLPWAVASGRPFRRPCWTSLEAVAEKGPDSQLRAYPPGRPEFWWYLTPSVHDATATDYVLL